MISVFVLLEDDFKTDVDLRVACLILDKQVKLINGNEANILIPQNWMKKYVEDQERGIDQQQAPVKQTPEIQSRCLKFLIFLFFSFFKEIETPKIVTTVAPRPRLIVKTEEPSLCVLCLTTERQVACLPCGHLTSCVACGHSLKTCPICRAAVKAFVRIYT
jgi:hypothetical protein